MLGQFVAMASEVVARDDVDSLDAAVLARVDIKRAPQEPLRPKLSYSPSSPSLGSNTNKMSQTLGTNSKSWLRKTRSELRLARNVVLDSKALIRRNHILEAREKKGAQEQSEAQKTQLRAKVREQTEKHGEVIGRSFQCRLNVDDAVSRTENSVTYLTHERYAGFKALEVCKRRIRIREDRPPTEMFRDALDKALETELQLLETQRLDLFMLENEGKDIAHALASLRTVLSRDTGERRLKIQQADRDLKIKLMSSMAVWGDQGMEDSDDEQRASEGVLAESAQLLERAANYSRTATSFIGRVRQDSKEVQYATEEALVKRCTFLAELKRNLEVQSLDVCGAIVAAEKSITRAEKRLDPKNNAAVQRLAEDKGVLEKLRCSRQVLKAEIQNKYTALEVDNLCRRVTAQKALAEQMQEELRKSESAPNLTMTATKFGKGCDTPSTVATLGDADSSSCSLSAKMSDLRTMDMGRGLAGSSRAMKASAAAQGLT